jgi:hypothetical protein
VLPLVFVATAVLLVDPLVLYVVTVAVGVVRPGIVTVNVAGLAKVVTAAPALSYAFSTRATALLTGGLTAIVILETVAGRLATVTDGRLVSVGV